MRSVAPPIDGTYWLNTDPIGPDVWRRRTTVLVFWTLGCEASRSLLHRLERLHHKLGGEVTVIAVHSPRFQDEQDIDRVRETVDRLGLTIPVLHDPHLTTWGRYNPPGWPAVVLINHRGKVVASGAGVGTSVLAEAIDQTRKVAASKRHASEARSAAGKRAASAPLPVPAPLPRAPHRVLDELRYPTGLAMVDTANHGELLAVVDSGNDRLITLEFDELSGQAFVVDEITGLDHPSSVCALDVDTLAVSEPDTGRVVGVDLVNKSTWTISNNLIRPLGLMTDRDGSLVVADAGADQLIRLSNVGRAERTSAAEDGDTRGVVAGSGTTGCDDGQAGRATLAQPVDLIRSGKGIAFVDLATSAVRVLTDTGNVLTSSCSSFREAGLVDGPLPKAVFDRPRAITRLDDNSLVVTDSGTSRLRRIANRRVTTIGARGLRQPEALLSLGHNVLVADTGNHRLVVVDRDAQTVRPVTINGLVPAFDAAPISSADLRSDESGSTITVPWPSTGDGPWTITVTGEPSTLVDGPLTFERSDPSDLISVPLTDKTNGQILVVATGADPVDVASFRIDAVVARTSGRIQMPSQSEQTTAGRSRRRSSTQSRRQKGKQVA